MIQEDVEYIYKYIYIYIYIYMTKDRTILGLLEAQAV